MTAIPGTILASKITSGDTTTTFPVADSIEIKGGLKAVADSAARGAIPTARLEEGCLCYQQDTDLYYRWDGSMWVLVGTLSSAASSTTATADTLVLRDSSGRSQVAAPSADSDIATKGYVDSVATGLTIHTPVLVASTANLTLSGEQTIDGVLTSASRVLVKNQTTASQNGIYVSAAGAWARATDLDAWSEVPGSFVFVQSGTVNGLSGYANTNVAGGTIGVTSMTWSQFSQAGSYLAGTGLALAGNTFSATYGTTAGTAAQGNDTRITGALQAANNLSDLVSPAVAALNLGLAPIATTANGGDLVNASVGTLQLANSSVTAAKLAAQAAHTFLANATGASASPTAVTVTAARVELLPADGYSGHIETPTAKIYVLDEYASAAGTINSLRIALSAGTATVAIKINGTNVTGLSAVSVTTSQSGTNASAANTYAAGARITLVVSSPSSAADLTFSLATTLT